MKKSENMLISLSIILLPFAQKAIAQSEWIAFRDSANVPFSKPVVNLLSATVGEITMNVQIDGMRSADIEVGNEIYQKIAIPNGGHTAEIGKPELPTVGRFIEIPPGVTPRITVASCEFKEIDGFDVYPAQEPLPDMGWDDQEVIFEKNAVTYSSDSFYPEQITLLDQPHLLRGHRIVLVLFYPVQYNPVSRILRVYSEIVVRVEHEGASGPLVAKNDDFFRPLLERILLNYESSDFKSLSKSSRTSESKIRTQGFGSGGADYLIITNDNYYDSILPLADWKHRKGLKVRIADSTDIVQAGYSWTADNIFNSTFTGIDGYIKNAYDTWDPAPSFVLLVGDSDKLPTHYINDHPTGSGYEEYEKVGTDLYYAAMDDANDSLSYVPFPDIFIGRLPARTNNDVKTIVNKIIQYEANPYTGSTSWFSTVLLAAYDQPGRYFIATSEAIRTFLEGEGYTCNRVYTGGPYSGTTQDVIDNINNGCFLVNHRDHVNSENGPNGSYEGWGYPRFEASDVSSLNNSNYLPVMFSFNCRSGWFDGETDKDNTDPSPIPDCLGEAWLKANDKGGVGFIGSTRISWSGYNDELCKGHYDAIWNNFDSGYSAGYGIDNDYRRYLGHALNYGKFWMYDKYVLTGGSGYPYTLTTSKTRTEFEEFHVLGDPGLEIWTGTPYQFTNVAIIDNGSSVSVNTGVSGSTICASSSDQGDTFYEVANNTSSHTFNTSVRPLYITVTKHNYIPYQVVTGGTFATDQTWYGHGTLYVRGDLSVASSRELTIKPGAEVKFKTGMRLLVYGTLIAEGSADEHITFDIAGSGTWHGVHVYSSNNRFKYCDFKNSCYEGLELYGSPNQATNNRVEYCSFEDNYEYGLSIINNDNPKIVHCRNISNNDDGGIYINNSEWVELEDTWVFSHDEDGIYSSYSEFLFDGCLVKWNDDGIYSYTDDYLDFSWDDPWGGGNSIHDNDDEGVFIYNYQYTKVWMDWNSDLPNSVYSNDGYEVQIIYSGSAQVFAAEVYWGSNPTWYGNVYHDEPLSSDQTGLPKSIKSDFPWQSMNFVKSDNPHPNPREELSEEDLKLIIKIESDTDAGVEALKRLRMLMRRKAREEKNPVLTAELPDYLRTLYRDHKHTKVGHRALVFLAREEMRRDAYEEAITLAKEGQEFLDGADLQMTKEILTWLYIHTGEYEKANLTLADLSNSYGQDPECARYASSLEKMLYRATGVWKATQPGERLAKELLPTTYGLAQNYPNPFNPITTLRYELPEASRMRLVIYDIIGREVMNWEGVEEAGYRQVLWHGADQQGRQVPTGIYIYRLVAASVESDKRFTASRKMVLLK